MFFKAKIEPAEFANYLIRDHQAIFGRRNLDNICSQLGISFRDQQSYIEAFFELQAFGLYSITSGVKTQCGENLRAEILGSLNERFIDTTGTNWEMMRTRVDQYQEFSNRGPTGGLAAQNILDKPPGSVSPRSAEAFGFGIAMNASYLDALKTVENLFKQFRFVI